MKDRFGQIIYIGKASNLKKRVSFYFSNRAKKDSYNAKIFSLIRSIYDFDYICTRNETESLILESKLIKQWRPRYNTDLKDDKSFSFIRYETHKELPRFTISRYKKEDSSIYFGPYLTNKRAKDIISYLKKEFGILDEESHPKKLNESEWKLYDDARSEIFPHKNTVSRDEYIKRCECSINFLEKQKEEVISELEYKMLEASKAENFEKAAKIRDALLSLSNRSNAEFKRKDIFSNTDEVTAIKVLSDELGFDRKIFSIECFDISHISGSFCVASMVRFEDGKANKSKYRRFKIKSFVGNDDFKAMQEVVERRYKKAPLPDLIVIDGGKGQVSATLKIFSEEKLAKVKIIGLAKKEETIISSNFETINLSHSNEGLKLLQRIRDEAHRFANSFSEKLRSRKIRESVLDDFTGLGKLRKKVLIEEFGGISKLKSASIEDLASSSVIGKEVAKRLYNFLKSI